MAGATKVGNLAVVLSGNAAPLSAVLDSSRKDLRRFAGDASSFGRSGGAGGGVGGLMAGLAGGAGGAAATAGATLAMTAATAAGNLLSGSLSSVAGLTLEAAKTAVRAAADYERMGVAFEVMTGSAKAGRKMMEDLQRLAVATPFGFADLSKAGQMLMGFGVGAEAIIPALSRIGDIAAGDGEKLSRLARAYGQVQALGRLQGDELNQFTEAGVGVKNFARAAGMGMAEFKAAMEQGKIGADVVTKALNDMTSAGGTFFGMNAKQSATVTGRWNAITESVTNSLARIGEEAFKKLDVSGRLGRVADWFSGMEAGAQPFLATLGKAGPLVDDVIAGATGYHPAQMVLGWDTAEDEAVLEEAEAWWAPASGECGLVPGYYFGMYSGGTVGLGDDEADAYVGESFGEVVVPGRVTGFTGTPVCVDGVFTRIDGASFTYESDITIRAVGLAAVDEGDFDPDEFDF